MKRYDVRNYQLTETPNGTLCFYEDARKEVERLKDAAIADMQTSRPITAGPERSRLIALVNEE